METSEISIFKSIILHPLRFCRENDDWDGVGNLLKFGISMLFLSIGVHLLRIATTSFIRNIDIFVALYSVFLWNLVFPIAAFIGSATVLQMSLYLFDKPDLRKTFAALEMSSVVLIIWSIIQLVAVRVSLSVGLTMIFGALAFMWSLYIFFQAFRSAHELSIEKTTLILGAPFAVIIIVLSIKPDLLNFLDTLHDFAWQLPGYLGYSN